MITAITTRMLANTAPTNSKLIWPWLIKVAVAVGNAVGAGVGGTDIVIGSDTITGGVIGAASVTGAVVIGAVMDSGTVTGSVVVSGEVGGVASGESGDS